jgi:hypothetical protein
MTELPEAVRSRLLPLDRTLETLETPALLTPTWLAGRSTATAPGSPTGPTSKRTGPPPGRSARSNSVRKA